MLPPDGQTRTQAQGVEAERRLRNASTQNATDATQSLELHVARSPVAEAPAQLNDAHSRQSHECPSDEQWQQPSWLLL